MSYPGRADHLQRYRIAFNFSDVAIDLVRGETYVLTLLLVRHVRQDQSLSGTAFQWHPAIGEDLGPSGVELKKPLSHFSSIRSPIALSLLYNYRVQRRLPLH